MSDKYWKCIIVEHVYLLPASGADWVVGSVVELVEEVEVVEVLLEVVTSERQNQCNYIGAFRQNGIITSSSRILIKILGLRLSKLEWLLFFLVYKHIQLTTNEKLLCNLTKTIRLIYRLERNSCGANWTAQQPQTVANGCLMFLKSISSSWVPLIKPSMFMSMAQTHHFQSRHPPPRRRWSSRVRKHC